MSPPRYVDSARGGRRVPDPMASPSTTKADKPFVDKLRSAFDDIRDHHVDPYALAGALAHFLGIEGLMHLRVALDQEIPRHPECDGEVSRAMLPPADWKPMPANLEALPEPAEGAPDEEWYRYQRRNDERERFENREIARVGYDRWNAMIAALEAEARSLPKYAHMPFALGISRAVNGIIAEFKARNEAGKDAK
jgi:hypothetical protein